MTMPEASQQATAVEWYVLLHPHHRISRSYRASLVFKSLFSNVSVSQQEESQDQEFVTLSLLCDDATQGSSVGHRPVSEACIMPHTRTWFVGTNYSLVFVMDMSASMAAVSGESVLLDDVYHMLELCLQALVQPLKIPGYNKDIHPCLCITVLACTCDCSKQKGLHVIVQGIHVTSANVNTVIQMVLEKLQQIESSLTVQLGSGPASQNMLESMLKAGTLGMHLLPRTSIKGVIAFTDGVSGFNSSSSMHATITEMRTNNISCWIFRAGSRDTASWGYGLVPDCETLSFVAMASNGCVLNIREILEDRDPQKLSKLQSSLLFMSCQRRVSPEQRESCSGSTLTRMQQEVFHRSTIEGPLESVLGCRIREGFLVSSIREDGSRLEISLCLPLQPDVFVYYTISLEWPPQPFSSHSVTIGYEAQSSLVYDVSHDSSQTNISPYRASAVKRLKQFLHNLRQADRLLGQLLSFSANPAYSKVPSANRNGMPVFFMPPNQKTPVLSVDQSREKERSPEEQAFHSFWRPVCTLDIQIWKKWMHSHKMNLILSPDTYLPIHVLQPSATTGRFGALSSRFAFTKVMDFLRSWSSFIMVEHHTFVKFLPKAENPSHFCLVRVVQRPPTVVLHVGCLEGMPHQLLLEVIESLQSGVRKLVQPAVPLSSSGGGRKRVDRSIPFSVTDILKPLQKIMVWYSNTPQWLIGEIPHAEDPPLLHMQYLSCHRGAWLLPRQVTKHDIAGVLLRQRLSEGFHISSCEGGIITMVLQLPVEQDTCKKPHYLLLQYVLFLTIEERRDSTVLASEVWMEQQHGEVVGMPRHLREDSQTLYIKDVADKVTREDARLLSAAVTFYQLHECCSNKSKPSHPSAVMSLQADQFQASVPMALSSLLPHSQIVGILFTAFSHPSEATVSDAPGVSDGNRHVEQLFHCSVDKMFDVRLPPTPLGHSLEARLSATVLSNVKERCGVLPQQWHAWVKRENESLLVLLLPATVWPSGGSRTYLPIILLLCKPEFLLQPYPNETTTVAMPEDELLLCVLGSVTSENGLHLRVKEQSLEHVIESIRASYAKCFLHACYHRLCQSQELAEVDVRAALELCDQISSVIDYGPFFEQVCAHCTSVDGTSLQVTPPEGNATCQEWAQDLQEEVAKILARNHLYQIPLCPECYFYQLKEIHPPAVERKGSGLPADYEVAESEGNEETMRVGPDADNAKDGSSAAVSRNGSLGEDSDVEEEDFQIGVLLSDDDTEPSPVDLTALDPPLFVHVHCVVQVEGSDRMETSALLYPVPTCLESILASTNLDKAERVRVSILMDCLHPPALHPTEPADSTGDQPHEDLGLFPAKQRLALRSLQNQIEWILKDEVLAACLQHGCPSEELLTQVAAHTSEAPREGNCFKDHIPISFALGVNRCQERFIDELKAISIEDHCLEEIGSFFLLTQKVREVPLEVDGDSCEVKVPMRSAHRRSNSYGGPTLLPVPPKANLKKSRSIQSSATNLTEGSRSRLSRSFWLVLHVLSQGTQQYVQLYFQRRSCFKWSDEEKAYHNQICSSLKMDIERTNRRVNQWFLLKDMLDTQRCHHLLLAESRPMEWLDKIPCHGEDPGRKVTSSGIFECECVYHHSFTPYWRLKVSAAKNLARLVLDPCVVSNREDVFVVSEKEKGKQAIFYIRIDESMCEEDSFLPKEDIMEPSVALDGRETVLSTLDTASSLSVQMGEREEVEQGAAADTQSIISRPAMVESLSLAFYGICSPSPKLVDGIINELQKKLDDKALDLLCSLYSRSTVKLFPQDISFIQPKSRKPKTRLCLPIPELFKDSCQALSVYFLQLLGTFTIKPLYSSPEVQHFKGSVDDATFLYLRPVQQGRGLGLMAVTLCDSSGKEIPFCPGVTRPKPSGLWTKEDMEQLLSRKEPSDVAFSIAIWEHGNVAIPELEARLNAVYDDALHTCFLELFLLPSPITMQDPQNHPSLPSSPHSPSSNLESSYTLRRPLMSVGDFETSLDFTLTGPEQAMAVSDFPVRSKHDTVSIADNVAKALLAGEEDEEDVATLEVSYMHQTWKEKELEERLQQAKIEQQQMAESGTDGQLTPSYSTHLIEVLRKMHSSHSTGIHHWSGQLFAGYDAARLTTSLISLIPKNCWEFCTRAFKYSSTEDTFKQVDLVDESNQEVLVVGYCIRQWQEARKPFVESSHSNLPWMDPNTRRPVQLFHPLDSKKIVTKLAVPFQSIAVENTVFVPRQRLVVVLTNVKQVDMYAYNLSDDVWSALMADAQRHLEWLQLRMGLLQHILLQKMGLFSHADSGEINPWTSEAANHCRQYSGLVSLIRNEVPPIKEVSLESGRNIPISVEEAYLDAVNIPTLPPVGNPVFRHGKQLEAIAVDNWKAEQRSKTLDKAFNAWHQKKAHARMPVPSRRLDTVKDLSRLLHICSTPILDQSMKDRFFASKFQEDFMARYLMYLGTHLNFVHIVESGSVPDTQCSSQSQCTMQRALEGGILLAELTADQNVFTIRVLSLERSRAAAFQRYLREVPGVSGSFPDECARLKDATHLHSFSYDFHVQFLHQIFTGKTTAPVGLDATSFLCSFYEENQQPPKYIRTRLLHSVVKFLDLDPAAQSHLYRHVLAHSASFGMRTLDVYDGAGEESSLCLLWESCATALNLDFGRDVFPGYNVDAVLVHCKAQLHFFIMIVHQGEAFPSKTVSNLVADYCQPESDTGCALVNLHVRLLQSMESKLIDFQRHLRREFLWKKLLYGPTPGRTEAEITGALSYHEMEEMLALVQRVSLVTFDPALKHLLGRKQQWYRSIVSLLEQKYASDVRSCEDSVTGCTFTAVINPLWTDMLILVTTNVKAQTVDIVYRKPPGVSPGELHPHVEEEQCHIQSFVNFVSSFLWANMLLRSKP